MSPVSPLFSFDQPRFPQYLEVLGYSCFGNIKPACQSTHAKIVGEKKVDDSKTRLVCKGLEDGKGIMHRVTYLRNCLIKT
jgi:hypothetical protein